MSQFQRRVSLGVGLVLFAVFGLALGAELLSSGGLESDALSADDVIAGVLVLLGSAAFVVAGVREEFRLAGRPLEWWQAMSAGFVLVGLAFAIPALSQLSSSSGVLNAFGGVLMVLSGYAQLRNGQPTEDDDSELSMREVAMIVVGGMAVIFAILFVQLFFTFS